EEARAEQRTGVRTACRYLANRRADVNVRVRWRQQVVDVAVSERARESPSPTAERAILENGARMTGTSIEANGALPAETDVGHREVSCVISDIPRVPISQLSHIVLAPAANCPRLQDRTVIVPARA